MMKSVAGARLKRFLLAAAVVGIGSSLPAVAQEILGPEAAACRAGASGPAVLVRIYGFKDRTGNVRVQFYGDNPEEFLAKGKKVKRVELPTTPAGDMNVCAELPNYGDFALVVLHDRDANGKLSVWNDGVGFSNNPKLGLSKPDHDKVVFTARPGVSVIDVVLNYRKGLSVKPLVARRD